MFVLERMRKGDASAERSQKRSYSAALGSMLTRPSNIRGGRVRLLIVLRVLFRVRGKILRHVRVGINRVSGADRNAGAAINAVHGIDEELLDFRELGFIFPRMDAIHWTNFDAFFILCTTFNNDE